MHCDLLIQKFLVGTLFLSELIIEHYQRQPFDQYFTCSHWYTIVLIGIVLIITRARLNGINTLKILHIHRRSSEWRRPIELTVINREESFSGDSSFNHQRYDHWRSLYFRQSWAPQETCKSILSSVPEKSIVAIKRFVLFRQREEANTLIASLWMINLFGKSSILRSQHNTIQSARLNLCPVGFCQICFVRLCARR